jgi:hypothetical protein
MKPGEWVRVASLFSLVELALVANYMNHYVLAGMLFLEGVYAIIATMAFSAGFLIMAVCLLKRYKAVYPWARLLALLFAANSIMNLTSCLMFPYITGFLDRILGSESIYGFVLKEVMTAICSITLFWMIGKSKKALE